MLTAQDCRQLADECRQSANKAETEVVRAVFLAMAGDWIAAALRAEGLLPPPAKEAPLAL